MKSVNELRAAGFKVKCTHYRAFNCFFEQCKTGFKQVTQLLTRREFEDMFANTGDDELQYTYSNCVLPYGGYTHVSVITPEGVELNGYADCSVTENYNKRIGVAIALGRAMNGAS